MKEKKTLSSHLVYRWQLFSHIASALTIVSLSLL